MRAFCIRLTYLRHQSISAGAFVVFELDIRIVVGYQLHKPGVVVLDPTLGRSTGCDRVLAHVGLVLLEHQWLHLARVPELWRAAQWAAAVYAGHRHHTHNQRQREPPPEPGRHHNNATAAVAVPHIRLPDTALPRPLLIRQSVAKICYERANKKKHWHRIMKKKKL